MKRLTFLRQTTLIALLAFGATSVMAQTVGDLTSYIRDTYGRWHEDDVIQLATGDGFALGPQQVGGGTSGTWAWTGPNGYTASKREVQFSNVTTADAGTYIVTCTVGGKQYQHEVQVWVDGLLSADDQLPGIPANEVADLSYKAYQDIFLMDGTGQGGMTYYREGYGSDYKLYCWDQGLVMQMLTDRYRFRGDVTMKPLISKVLDAFTVNENAQDIKNEGKVPYATHKKYSDQAVKAQLSDWTWNFFNDDLLWMSLPYIRGYLITGEKRFLAQARWTWDYLYERGWDGEMGGGIWWSLDNLAKSGLSNNPAICLSAYLYEATGEDKYLERAKQTFEWVYAVLRNDDGSVDENINIEKTAYPNRANGYNVYNQGTFIEGAAALYRITGDERYYTAAKQTLDYVMLNHVNINGIMSWPNKVDGTVQSEFARGVAFLLEARPELWKQTAYYGTNRTRTTYYNWLRKNADAAWNMRDLTYNVADCGWARRTRFDITSDVARKHAEVYVSSVVMTQVVPADNPWSGDIFTGFSVEVPTPVEDPNPPLAATPYATDAYGEWQTARIGINVGDPFALRAETDLEGEWTWTGPNGKMSKNDCEISYARATMKMSGTYIATCTAGDGTRAVATFLVSVMQSEKPVITPYAMGANGWQETTTLDIRKNASFSLGPQVKNASNTDKTSWAWEGPNNYKATDREIKLTRCTTDQAGTYTVTFTDLFGRRAQLDFLITMDGQTNGIDQLEAEDGDSQALYNLSGMPVRQPQPDHIYINSKGQKRLYMNK